MFTTRSKAARSWQRRQLGDHLPWRCLQKVLPRAEQTKLSETRDRLGPVEAHLSLSPSSPRIIPFGNVHNAPLHAIFVASKRFERFRMAFWLICFTLCPDSFCSASFTLFIHSVIHLVAWPRSGSAAFDCFFGAVAISDLTCFDLHASRAGVEAGTGVGKLTKCPEVIYSLRAIAALRSGLFWGISCAMMAPSWVVSQKAEGFAGSSRRNRRGSLG